MCLVVNVVAKYLLKQNLLYFKHANYQTLFEPNCAGPQKKEFVCLTQGANFKMLKKFVGYVQILH